MKIKHHNLSKAEIANKFFHILNAAQPAPEKRMTDREIQMLSAFVTLPPKFDYYRFSDVAKAKVQKQLLEDGWKVSRPSMNAKVYSLIEKEILWRDEDRVVYVSKYILTVLRKIFEAIELDKPFNVCFEFYNEPLTQEDFNGTESISSTDTGL